jgi:hypothetical protein
MLLIINRSRRSIDQDSGSWDILLLASDLEVWPLQQGIPQNTNVIPP